MNKTLHLYRPDQNELISTLSEGLAATFEEVEVVEVTCPNLSLSPWNLASNGITGDVTLADIGGPDNIHYTENNGTVFNLQEISKIIKKEGYFVAGPGAASTSICGINGELVANLNLSNRNYKSHCTLIDNNNSYITKEYKSEEIGVLANLFLCKGEQDKVIKIKCKKRIGKDNFVTRIRQIINNKYKDKTIGMAGVFQIVNGNIKAHVMPDFCGQDLLSNKQVNDWLRFFEMKSPLTCVCTLVSNDLDDLNLRLEHCHFYSDHGDGGHYHYDITPDIVEYDGYFVLAENLHRIAIPSYSLERNIFFQK